MGINTKRLPLYVLLSLSLICVPTYGLTTYEGSLSWTSDPATTGIVTVGPWASTQTQISWAISSPALTGTGFWHYDYTITVPTKAISHVVLETSLTFNEGTLESTSWTHGWEINWFDPEQGNSNPNMPEEMYGIKFDSATGTNVCFSLDTVRAPKWGDVYFKGGSYKEGGVNSPLYAFNAGFTSPDFDPTDLPQNGSVDGQHPLVPDTTTGGVGDVPVVPEPLTALGMMLGVSGLVRYVRRTR